MDISFDCTQCGRCCHDLRLTLSVAEAQAWAGRGHRVDLLAEAWPWADDAGADDPVMQWRAATSFATSVGDVPFRINLRLVAHHDGPCPHLLPDMRCGNYQHRPRICRIYPLESRPFEAMIPARRKCPPEAWAPGLPVIERDGVAVNAEAAMVLAAHRAAQVADVITKAHIAAVLGFADAALAGEGLAVCEVAPAALLEAIEAAEALDDLPDQHWTIVTNRATTHAMLVDLDCPVRLAPAGQGYLASFEDQLAA